MRFIALAEEVEKRVAFGSDFAVVAMCVFAAARTSSRRSRWTRALSRPLRRSSVSLSLLVIAVYVGALGNVAPAVEVCPAAFAWRSCA